MASKALTKEARSIVSQKTSAVRKRMTEQSTIEKLAVGGGGTLGAGTAAVLDGFDVGIPVGKTTKIPLTPIMGAVTAGIGLAMGRGVVAAGFVGIGFGAGNCWLYHKIRTAIEERDQEGAEGAED